MLDTILDFLSKPDVQIGLYIIILICMIVLYISTIVQVDPVIIKTMITVFGGVSMILLALIVVAEARGNGTILSRFKTYLRTQTDEIKGRLNEELKVINPFGKNERIRELTAQLEELTAQLDALKNNQANEAHHQLNINHTQ